MLLVGMLSTIQLVSVVINNVVGYRVVVDNTVGDGVLLLLLFGNLVVEEGGGGGY